MESDPGIDGRLWRVEQRQSDVLHRLDKIEAKIDEITRRQDERSWRISLIEERLEASRKRQNGNGKLLPVESALIKTILYGLLAMVGALATGQFVRLLGFFGGE